MTTDVLLPGGGRTAVTLFDADLGTDAERTGPVLVVVPAMGVPAGYYTPFAEALAAEGVAVALADYPGHGVAEPPVSRRSTEGYEALAGDWLNTVLATVGELAPGRPVALLGHSLGGQVALAHLAWHPQSPARALVLVGSGSPYWRLRPLLRGLWLLVQTQTVGLVTRVARHWPGHRLGFGGRQPRPLMLEWVRFARTGRLPVPSGALEAVALPVFAVDLDHDELAPPETVDGLLALAPAVQADRWQFTKAVGAPGRPVDHYSFARSPEVIAQRIADWVLDHAASASAGAGQGVGDA